MRTWTLWATLALSLVITLPVLAPAAAGPLGTQTRTDAALAHRLLAAEGIVDPNLTIITVDGLTLPGGKSIVGYVNMLDSRDVIYVQPFTNRFPFRNSEKVFARILLHEYSHILQKRLAVTHGADTGYGFAATLLELNQLLGSDADNVDPTAGLSAFTGLEVNADCVAAVTSPTYTAHYFAAGDTCTPAQEAAARAIRANDWPTGPALAGWVRVVTTERATQALVEAAAAVLSARTGTATNRGEYCAILAASNATC